LLSEKIKQPKNFGIFHSLIWLCLFAL